MKKTLLLLVFVLSFTAFKAQILDSVPHDAFAFPLGRKVTIKLVPVDSVKFQYYVTDISSFAEVVDTYKDNNLFSKKPEADTIELLFCIGTHGDTQEEREKNYKTLLILRNNLSFPLEYNADMRVYQQEEFEPTSVVTLFPGTLMREMWPYMIEEIALYNFRKMTGFPFGE